MRLFHFSDDPDIGVFVPRPVRTAAPRRPGQEWLNGPLVWAIEEDWSPLYLFPRDCPRILLRPIETTTPEDLAAWWGGRSWRMIAHVEAAWIERLRTEKLYRYELPTTSFESLGDAGMWISRRAVEPLSMTMLDDLPAALASCDVDLRIMDTLAPLRGVWSPSLHASGIRLRNAQDWS